MSASSASGGPDKKLEKTIAKAKAIYEDEANAAKFKALAEMVYESRPSEHKRAVLPFLDNLELLTQEIDNKGADQTIRGALAECVYTDVELSDSKAKITKDDLDILYKLAGVSGDMTNSLIDYAGIDKESKIGKYLEGIEDPDLRDRVAQNMAYKCGFIATSLGFFCNLNKTLDYKKSEKNGKELNELSVTLEKELGSYLVKFCILNDVKKLLVTSGDIKQTLAEAKKQYPLLISENRLEKEGDEQLLLYINEYLVPKNERSEGLLAYITEYFSPRHIREPSEILAIMKTYIAGFEAAEGYLTPLMSIVSQVLIKPVIPTSSPLQQHGMFASKSGDVKDPVVAEPRKPTSGGPS